MKKLYKLKVFFTNLFILLFLFFSTPVWADLGASVTLSGPNPIYPGEVTNLEITLSNNNTVSTITGVGFANNLPGILPDGLKVSGVATYQCTDPADPAYVTVGTLTAPNGGQAISLAGGEIPANDGATDGTCLITVPVTAESSDGSSATYTYQILDGAVTGTDNTGAVANIGDVSQSITTRIVQRPVISHSFASSTLILGGASTVLTMVVNNPNPIAITNFDIANNFPIVGSGGALIQVANPTNATSSCTGAGIAPAFAPSVGDTVVTATAGEIAPNGSCTITVNVEARHTDGVYETSYASNIIDGVADFDTDLGLEPLNSSASIRTRSPLRVSKMFDNSQIASGQSDVFSIILSNDGDSPITVTSFTDSPIDHIGNPAYGLKADSINSVTCTGTGSAGSYGITTGNFGIEQTSNTTIAAGGSCTIRTNFTATAQANNVPMSLNNTIAEGDVVIGAEPGIISQSASASILVSDELRILKSRTPSNVAPGNPIRYSVTVQNWSASVINNIDVTDNFSNGQTFLTGTINGFDYSPSLSGTGCVGLSASGNTGDASVIFTIGTLPARTDSFNPGACEIRFWAMTDVNATDNSAVVNVINPGDVCYNAGANCNGSSSDTTTGIVDADTLTLSKSFSPAGPLSENTITTMTISFSNLSLNDLTSLSVSDNLPAANSGTGQLRVANPANAVTTCGSGVITAVPNSTSITLNGGTVPARANNGLGSAGTCILQVDVVGPAGIYDNTAIASANEIFANGSANTINAVNSNVASITYTSALSASKFFTPSSISSGGKSTATIRLNNGGSIPITGLSLTDPLPAGMVLANPVNASTSCAGNVTFTGNAGDSSISLSGAEIAPNGTCDVIFDVTATGSANWVNTIPAGNIVADGNITNQTNIVGTLTYNPPTAIILAKATNPSTLTSPGQVSQMTVTITNGTAAVTGLSFTDYFTADGTVSGADNGMRIAANPAPTTDCPGGIVNAVAGGNSFSVSGISMPASALCTVSVNVTSVAVGGITNTIPANSVTTDQGLTNSGPATTSLTTQGNLGVVKEFIPNVIKAGERARLKITLLNPTAQPAYNINVVDNLPAGVTVPNGANPTTTCTGANISAPAANQVSITGASLSGASGGVTESCYSEIDVISTIAGDYTNTIAAGDLTGTMGGIPVTNSQPASDILRVRQPIVINKAIGGFTLDSGNPAGLTTGTASSGIGAATTLTIVFTNNNASPLTEVSLTDTLPTGLVVAQNPATSTTCTGGTIDAFASSNIITMTGATVPASGSCSLTVQVLSNIAGTYVNTIPAGAISSFEGITNDEVTSAKLIVSSPPTISKDLTPASIPSGGTSRLNIYIENKNATAMTLTSAFVDNLPTLPGAMLIAATPNLATTCPGVVSANAGSSTITYMNGSQIPAGGCTISVDVTATAAGKYNNNIPAGALQTDLGSNPQPANAELTVNSLGYVAGRVFIDNNVVPNGAFDANLDTPLSGITIELRIGADCTGALLETKTTTTSGSYAFTDLASGTYSVCQGTQPNGTVNGPTTAGAIVSLNGSTGTAGTASNPTTNTSQIVNITLNADGGAGEISGTTDNNFAEIILSKISGSVFTDNNNDGIKNGTDAGISGITIELLDNANNVIDTVVTDSNGTYIFENLQPGTYSVREVTQPTGTNNGITTAGAVPNGGTAGVATAVNVTPSQINNIVLPPNTTAEGNNFAEIPNSRKITGSVFLDYNNNATEDGSEYGLPNITIDLAGTDINGAAVAMSTTTDSDGKYSFENLPEGTYGIIQNSQPAGTTNGTTTAGTAGGIANNPTGSTSQITNISLTGSTTLSTANNFAEIPNAAADLTISKTHSPTSFAAGSNSGTFTITPENIGTAATSGTITITDTLPAGITLASLPSGTGWSCTGSVGDSTFTCTTSDVITASATGNVISFRANVANGLEGQLLTNQAVISGGGEPAGFDGNNTALDSVSISTSANIRGTVWRDYNHNRVVDAGEALVSGWQVELLFNSTVIDTTTTASDGTYVFSNVSPATGYEIRFREPVTGTVFAGAVPNEQGVAPVSGVRDITNASNGGTNAGNPAGADVTTGTLRDLQIFAGDNIIEQSLPLDPAGIIYNAVTRAPVEGAQITITGPAGFNPAIHLVGGTDTITTAADGFYQFLLTPTAPVGVYNLAITGYPAGFLPAPSVLIPACTNTITADAVPDPALIHDDANPPDAASPIHDPATCPAATGALAPANQATTQYYMSFNLDAGVSGDVVNNHIPLDPLSSNDVVITKTTPVVNTSIGKLVPYTITINNTTANNLVGLDVVDNLPKGFKYVKGSATLDGAKLEPTVNKDGTIVWENQTLNAGETKSYKIILVVGSGVDIGTYINRAHVTSAGITVSNIASASVRVIPDPVFDCSAIIGKVFDDTNANGYQDEGEGGIANVRIATLTGLLITTDPAGRFHVACADIPDIERGSNFLLKLDERTLPTGYRITTENPRSVRVTRGKMTTLNFGAAIQRVVRIDIQDSAFIKDKAKLKEEWLREIEKLPNSLRKAPSVIRVSYTVKGESVKLAKKRIKYVVKTIENIWSKRDCCHEIMIEEELINLDKRGGSNQ